MKIFLDTAIVEEIRAASAWGVVDGVTTNPSLIVRSGRVFEEVIAEICSLVDGPVSAEVTALDAAGMVREARPLAALHRNVVIKVPMTEEGLKATHALKGEGIRTNVTLVFSAAQALLAAKAGASFVSPFVGRLDDAGHAGMEVIEQIRAIFDNYDFDCEIITASVRHPLHVIDAALAGADIATVPLKVLQQCLKHPLTDLGLDAFLKDWERARR
ncbi:MAG: fructose-6-phosphate aldolase [Acidobacteriota bacterium]